MSTKTLNVPDRLRSTSTEKTYIYIDVSNIRWACSWSCGFNLDFVKLYKYLKRKYPNTQEIRYYEGIATGDERKREHFRFLEDKIGYKVCSLDRKSYTNPPKYKKFKCKKCGSINNVKIMSEGIKLKSNVDVYLASDMIERAALEKDPIQIILLSCDGDYVEAIKAVLRLNPGSYIKVIATPMTDSNNYLSVRLKRLSCELPREEYKLLNINNIRKYISQPDKK